MLIDKMTIEKIQLASEYLPYINVEDADAEFYEAISENDEDIYAIYYMNEVVGLSNIIDDVWGFLYIYIFPQYRRKGYGKAAVKLSEEHMNSSRLKGITTCYLANSEGACEFAKACGYSKEFSSAYMKYDKGPFEEKILPVRQYKDEDFTEAQALNAEAFHKMRLDTGYFPNSVQEAPSVEMRKFWEDTADERYVYIEGSEIIGYAHLDGAELAEVSIKISKQGKGIGTEFIKFLVNKLLEKEHNEPVLYCVVGNKARHLYERIGFKEVTCNEYAKKCVQNE